MRLCAALFRYADVQLSRLHQQSKRPVSLILSSRAMLFFLPCGFRYVCGYEVCEARVEAFKLAWELNVAPRLGWASQMLVSMFVQDFGSVSRLCILCLGLTWPALHGSRGEGWTLTCQAPGSRGR